ncbi:hypothetical protein GQ543_03615 [candidate division WOR-3 bacterium]|nr:hypothetical protein [candidate division WOR-3 bacterium]
MLTNRIKKAMLTTVLKLFERTGIKQILCGVNHPQTNEKQERFHDFYKNHRARFNSLDELVE